METWILYRATSDAPTRPLTVLSRGSAAGGLVCGYARHPAATSASTNHLLLIGDHSIPGNPDCNRSHGLRARLRAGSLTHRELCVTARAEPRALLTRPDP